MFVFLDTVNHWKPGTAGHLTYNQFTQRLDMATMEHPIKYIHGSQKQDDTRSVEIAFAALKAQGVDNPTFAQAASVVVGSR